MKVNRKEYFFTFLAFCSVIAFLEIGLAFAAFMSPSINQLLLSPRRAVHVAHSIEDNRLGHRPNPKLPGHDSKGFRNVSVPKEAKIVALGDSQTYGTSVEPKDAWPRQLECLMKESVYSMAYGGYGPAHSLILWEEAASLNPDIYIEAFYSGNDLFDSFNLVYNRGQLPELKAVNKNIELIVKKAESEEPIAQRFRRMFRMGKDKEKKSKSSILPVRRFLSNNSKLYGLLRRAKYELLRRIPATKTETEWERAKKFAKENSDYYQIFENDQFKTIFTSEYRLSALNLRDSRISEGHRISLEAIRRMSERAAEENKQFLVVLIPTKELVFKNFVKEPSASYLDLIQNEEQIWKTTKEFLKNRDIEFVAALPSLREQLTIGIQPYLLSHNGHPNKHGHKSIARLVYKTIQRKQKVKQMAGQNASEDPPSSGR